MKTPAARNVGTISSFFCRKCFEIFTSNSTKENALVKENLHKKIEKSWIENDDENLLCLDEELYTVFFKIKSHVGQMNTYV